MFQRFNRLIAIQFSRTIYIRFYPNAGFQLPWFGGKVIHWCLHVCRLQIKKSNDFHRTKKR